MIIYRSFAPEDIPALAEIGGRPGISAVCAAEEKIQPSWLWIT